MSEVPVSKEVVYKVYFPEQVNANEIQTVEKKGRGKKAWSIPLTYYGQPLNVQIERSKLVFGLSKYKNPGKEEVRYSIQFSMEGEANKNMLSLIVDVDDIGKSSHEGEGLEYFSALRTNYNKPEFPPFLRVKVDSDGDKLIMDMYDENDKEYNNPSIALCEELIEHGREAIAIIQLNPIWCVGGKFGVSWKLKGLKLL